MGWPPFRVWEKLRKEEDCKKAEFWAEDRPKNFSETTTGKDGGNSFH